MTRLFFRMPGVPLDVDEVWRRLGRPGARKQPLRRASPGKDGFAPGEPVTGRRLEAGRAFCVEVRPVRHFRPPEAPHLRVLCGPLAWPEGEAPGLRFRTVAERGLLRELAIELDTPAPGLALDGLAVLGAPALGDVRRGGVLVAGGLRVREAGTPPPPTWWPDEPAFPPDDLVPDVPVSSATARALEGGHPWVRADAGLGDVGCVPVGGRIRLRGPDGRDLGLARSDGEGDLAARRWAGPGDEGASTAERVAAAVARRAALHAAADDTDAYRLVHAEADGLPGLVVDRLGPVVRVLVQGRAALGLRSQAIAALRAGLADPLGAAPAILEVTNLQRPRGSRLRGVHAHDPLPVDEAGRLVVREAGLRFRVDPGFAEPYRPRPGIGLFLDQRENRRRLRAEARGGRFANLFAHTGAFSLALLAGGAAEVWSVDLSRAYLARLEENLELNGLGAAGHHGVRRDARRFLEERAQDAPRFDGIVVDPPTAAASGRRYWSVRRDLGPLLARAWRQLAPGGWLLVTRNLRDRRGGLASLAQEAAAAGGGGLDRLEQAPPGPDFPRLPGFPEGDPFEGQLMRKSRGETAMQHGSLATP